MPRLLLQILLAVFFQALLWQLAVPIWHFPDEQAHFAQVQNYAEIGGTPDTRLDVSREIYESTLSLGTLRDDRGNNRFTYHPEARLDYSVAVPNNWPLSARTEYVKAESPRYPPLYYLYASFWYRLVYQADLFTRVYAVRFGSIFLHLLAIIFAFKFFSIIFKKHQSLIISATITFAFMPMFMFVQSGINNDILLNCLATGILWLLSRDLDKPITLKNTLSLIIFTVLGVFTKQLIYLLFPAIAIQFFYRLVKFKKFPVSLFFILIFVFFITSILFSALNDGFWQPFWPKLDNFDFASFNSLLTSRFAQLYRETLPWYFGVYKWLSVVLPLWLLRTLKLILGISVLGLFWQFLRQPRVRPPWWLLLVVNLSYFVILIIWDVSLTLKIGFAHGLQGRYFFPLLASHVAFTVAGLSVLFPKKYFLYGSLIFTLWFNYYSLYYLVSQYHTFTSLSRFASEFSLNKPAFFGWPIPLVLFTISLIFNLGLVAKIISKGTIKRCTDFSV